MQQLRQVFFLIVLLVGAPFLHAAPNVETVTVSANGKTQAIAVANALAQAVQQVNGVQVTAESHIVEKEPQIFIDWFGNKVVLEGGSFDKGAVNTKASGPIHSYRVTDSRKLANNEGWQVTLAVEVVHYEALMPERSHLKTLAIAPFSVAKAQFDTMAGAQSAVVLAADLQRQMNQAFVTSQRFRVLDRDFWPEMLREEQLVKHYGQSTQEYIKQGQKLGADILLVGHITRLDVSKRLQKMYDSNNTLYHADFLLDVQLLETATGEVLWSERFQRIMTHQQLRQALQLKLNPLQGQDKALVEEDIQRQLYAQLASDISASAVARFYPIRVLDKGEDSAIYLTYGDGLIKVGDMLEIYAGEKTLKHPDTGLEVKIPGKKVATVAVVNIDSYYASANVVEGDGNAIQANAIAKKRNPPLAQSEPLPARPLTPGSSEKPLQWP